MPDSSPRQPLDGRALPRVIETSRLTLRPWAFTDAEDVRACARGLATEAVGALVDAAFTALPQLARVRAMANARNTASQRVMEKVGMIREGVLRQNRVERDGLIDEAWYGILRTEWEDAGPTGSSGRWRRPRG